MAVSITIEPIVFIVDDDEAVSESLMWLVESVGLKGKAYLSADDYLAEYNPQNPGCLVLDVCMAGTGGLELLERLAAEEEAVPVIIMTAYGDMATGVRAMKGGAVDVIPKPFSRQGLLDCIKKAVVQDASNREERRKLRAFASRFESLTQRERQVFEGIVRGRHYKAIANDLCLSTKTVEYHRTKVMSKMDVDSVASLVRIAVALGAAQDNPGVATR